MTVKRQLIGSGKMAKIYVDEDSVFKVFPDSYPLEWLVHEVNVQTEVRAKTNILVPAAELLTQQREIKMSYIQGGTLADRMRKEKYKGALEDLVELQLSIYQYGDLDLPQSHETFDYQIRESQLDKCLKEKGLGILQQIDKKHLLCHYDFHFLNILYDEPDYYVIDWGQAKLGNPILDIARTYVVLKQYAQRLANKYLQLTVSKGAFKMEEVQGAIPLMAILRLLEADASDFQAQLLAMAQA